MQDGARIVAIQGPGSELTNQGCIFIHHQQNQRSWSSVEHIIPIIAAVFVRHADMLTYIYMSMHMVSVEQRDRLISYSAVTLPGLTVILSSINF